ncbi:hypothetical protein ACFQ07_25755, partial [Actinomadura adrarensis]
LLAAATTAESRPASSGTYWHVATEMVSPDGKIRLTSGTWTRRDGQTWISVERGKISKLPNRQPIKLRTTDIDLDGIQRLPTDPDALLATLRKHTKGRPSQVPNGPTIMLLQELLNRVPAPPKVRAAAFRSLASLPNIKNLGRVEGGYALEFSLDDGGTRMVVDPKTTTVNAQGFTSLGGGRQSMPADTTTGRWTDELPSSYQVVPLSQQKNRGIACGYEGQTQVCRLQ